jgi:hypothetical protein
MDTNSFEPPNVFPVNSGEPSFPLSGSMEWESYSDKMDSDKMDCDLPQNQNESGTGVHAIVRVNMLNHEMIPPRMPSTDLADSVVGMYRILDLISERGNSGLGE